MKKSMLSTMANARVGLSHLAENQFEKIRHAIGDARVVMIGEETHGTQEFYALRAEITKALIERENFSLVLCESDFPTYYRLHQFVSGEQASTQTLTASPSDMYSATSSSFSSSRMPPLPTVGGGPESPPSTDYQQPETPQSAGTTVAEVMEVLKTRFPVWMWRNEVVRDFAQWLQAENLRRDVVKPTSHPKIPVALFGLDIYSMLSSSDQVISYLDAVDPAKAERARQRYKALQKCRPHEEEQRRAVQHGSFQPQTNKIQAMLDDLDEKAGEGKNIFGDDDEYFSADEYARIVLAAEEYYRENYFGSPLPWNIRDHTMVDMIVNALELHDEKLKGHFDDDRSGDEHLATGSKQQEKPFEARAVVWGHNSHIGDAAATEEYERQGQVNVGHLVRQVLGKENCFLIGLSTNSGTVRAARRWNGKDSVMDLNPSVSGSTGDLLHQAGKVTPEMKDFGLFFRKNASDAASSERSDDEESVRKEMEEQRPERFIGVQYAKETERQSHYSMCSLSNQYDLLIHLDETSAVQPLPERTESETTPP